MAGSYVDGVSGAGNEVTGEPGATDATGTTGAGIEATGAGIEAIETVGAHGATETFDACATTGVGNEATSATEGGLAIATTGPRTSSFPFAIFLLRGLFHRSRSRCQINVFVLDQNNNAYLGIVDMCVCRSNNHFPLPVTRVEAHLLLVTRGRRESGTRFADRGPSSVASVHDLASVAYFHALGGCASSSQASQSVELVSILHIPWYRRLIRLEIEAASAVCPLGYGGFAMLSAAISGT